MGIEGPIKIMIFLNSIEEASELSDQLTKTNLNFDIMITNSLEHFQTTLSVISIDCFILDWEFKDNFAISLAEKLRKSKKYRKTPIVFMSDKKDARAPMQYSSLHVNLVITRPLNFDEFRIPLIKVLEQKIERIIPEHFEVLVVDNDSAILEIIGGHLKDMHHLKFDTCTSITEAKKCLNDKNYNLLLLDWNLDDGTCIDLIDFLRLSNQKKHLKEALIMVITGRSDVDDIMTLLRYNVKDHIIKPFDYHEFEEKISYALEKHNKNILKMS
jgi:DNA-binding response OmpR family regulator